MKYIILFPLLFVCFLGIAQPPPFEPRKTTPKMPPSSDWHQKHNGIQTLVDYPGEFPGGADSLIDYIDNHLVYPLEFFEVTEGNKVFVRFVIEKNGSVSRVEMLKDRTNRKSCAREAIALVKSMPNWKPGYSKNYFNDFKETTEQLQDSIPVRCYFTMPITFKRAKLPLLPHGYDSLTNYIKTNLVYPQQASKEKIQGRVYVKMIFNDTEDLADVILLRGVENCPECDKEVLRLLKSIPTDLIKANSSPHTPKPFFFNTFIELK